MLTSQPSINGEPKVTVTDLVKRGRGGDSEWLLRTSTEVEVVLQHPHASTHTPLDTFSLSLSLLVETNKSY